MTNRQQIAKLINEVDATAKQCRKDGDVQMARKYESESVKLAKELAAIDTANLKALLAK